MARQTFTIADEAGNSFDIEANSPEEAQAFVARGDAKTVERAFNQKKLGLSPADTAALFAGKTNGVFEGGNVADTGGKFDRAMIGAGRTFNSWKTGVQQMLPEKARKAIGLEDDATLAKHEQAARDLFGQLDNQGIGMEDLGQALPSVLAFAGGGSVGLGWKAFALASARGGATGALSGAIQGTTKEGERATNAEIGALAGALGPAIGVGTASLVKAASQTGRAGMSWLGSILSFSKGKPEADEYHSNER